MTELIEGSTLARGLALAQSIVHDMPGVIVPPWEVLPPDPDGHLLATQVSELGPVIVKWSTAANLGFRPEQPRGAKPPGILRCAAPLDQRQAEQQAAALTMTRPVWAHSLVLQRELDVDRGCLVDAEVRRAEAVLEFRADHHRMLVRDDPAGIYHEAIGGDRRIPSPADAAEILKKIRILARRLPELSSGWSFEFLLLDGQLEVLQLRPSPVDRPVGPLRRGSVAQRATAFTWGIFDEVATVADDGVLHGDNPDVLVVVRRDARTDMEPQVIAHLESGRPALLINTAGGSRITHEPYHLPPPPIRARFGSAHLVDPDVLVPGCSIRFASDGNVAVVEAV